MATYWVPDLPNIKGISGHLQCSIFIFANGASYVWSNRHINMLVLVGDPVQRFLSWKSLTYWNKVGRDWNRVSCNGNRIFTVWVFTFIRQDQFLNIYLLAPPSIHVQYNQLESIRLRHFTIRIDSHGVDPALPEVNIREITIQEPSSFLKRAKKLQSIRLRHFTIRIDSHGVDPALPEVNIREITIQEPSSFLKRAKKLQSIRLRHFTIRIDSHGVDPALPEVNIREITIQEPSSFLKRAKKLQSIRLRHVTIRLDSHVVDPHYRKSTSVK